MKIRFRIGEYSVAIFAHCGNFVSVLNEDGDEVARIIEGYTVSDGVATYEKRKDLMARAALVSAALNLIYQETNL